MIRLPECFKTFSVSGGVCRWNGVIQNCTGEEFSPAGAISVCDALLKGNADRLFKDRKKISAGIAGGKFVKLYKLPSPAAQLCRLFRPGRAIHSLLAAEKLAGAGVETPQVMAAVRRIKKFKSCDFLITQSLHDTEKTYDTLFAGGSTDENRSALLNEILPAVVKLHRNNITHGDLNLRNIYRSKSSSAGMIDLDGTRWHDSGLKMREREYELARLCSGYCKVCKDEIISEIIDIVTAKYDELCALSCNKNNICSRAEYLLNRRH